MTASVLHIIWTVLAMVVFVGIVIWAWSGRRRKDFEAMSQLPLEDDKHDGPESKS